MCKLFPNHVYGQLIAKHKQLPIFISQEFDFYRCISFSNNFYGKTVSELHRGNLRDIDRANRYSDIFNNRKVSYWSSDRKTAIAEARKHGASHDLIVFHAYDDQSSTFPTLLELDELKIVDGRGCGFNNILSKIDSGQELSDEENNILEAIKNEKPDCLAYESKVNEKAVNYLFFENGFSKLSLRSVSLTINKHKNRAKIVCAVASDYSPILESYGKMFQGIAKIDICSNYTKSEEYKRRKEGRQRREFNNEID